MVRKFEFQETLIQGLIEITPFYSEDNRGSFVKDYSREIFEANGITHHLEEVFYSTSNKGVIRGMHFQREKQQTKLTRCVFGHIYDIVVDLRPNSPTFRKWQGFDLTQENCKELLIPGGCAHGFLAVEESVMVYKCNMGFCSEYDDGIRWDDPDLGIIWPVHLVGGSGNLDFSDKDKNLQSYAEFMRNYGGLK